MGKMAEKLGLRKTTGIEAAQKAFNYYTNYQKKRYQFGKSIIEKITAEPTVILAGKPYVVNAGEANLALPRKIISRGYNVISADMLPFEDDDIIERNIWIYTQQLMNAVHYAKKYPNLFICFVSCFSCIADGSIFHFVRERLAGHTYCYLEIDAHTAHAGFDTRVGAFLDIIEKTEIRSNN